MTPFMAYGQSKLANGLFSRELARRLADTNATSNSLHPGVIPTNLSRHLPPRDEPDDSESAKEETRRPKLKTIPQRAATSCYVATNPSLNRVTRYYFADCNSAIPSEHMQDDDMAAKLWRVSEELTAGYRAWQLWEAISIFIQVVLSWINPEAYNPATIIIYKLTDPLLRPARKLIPPMGGLDFSVLVVFIILQLTLILIVNPITHLGQSLSGIFM